MQTKEEKAAYCKKRYDRVKDTEEYKTKARARTKDWRDKVKDTEEYKKKTKAYAKKYCKKRWEDFKNTEEYKIRKACKKHSMTEEERRVYMKEYWKNYKEGAREHRKEYADARRQKNHKWLWELIFEMLGTECEVCGKNLKDRNRNEVVVHLHHRNPSEKIFNIVGEWYKYSLEQIIEEIEKTVICCGGFYVEGKGRGNFGWWKSCHFTYFHGKGIKKQT